MNEKSIDMEDELDSVDLTGQSFIQAKLDEVDLLLQQSEVLRMMSLDPTRTVDEVQSIDGSPSTHYAPGATCCCFAYTDNNFCSIPLYINTSRVIFLRGSHFYKFVSHLTLCIPFKQGDLRAVGARHRALIGGGTEAPSSRRSHTGHYRCHR